MLLKASCCVPPQAPFGLNCWWPWASGPLTNVPAPCLWPPPPPAPPHPLSNHIPNLHGHPATEQKPHPEEKYRPLFQVPLPLYSCLFSVIPPPCCHLFLEPQLRRPRAAACPPQLFPGGELRQALRLPLHPEVRALATYPGHGTSPQPLPEPLSLGSTLSFLSGPLNPQPLCTQGYLQVCHEPDPKPGAGVVPG